MRHASQRESTGKPRVRQAVWSCDTEPLPGSEMAKCSLLSPDYVVMVHKSL